MTNPATITGILIFICSAALAQDTLFFENFDDSPGSKPDGWSTGQEASPDKIWEFVDGGGTTQDPPTPGSRRPTGAYSGDVNALYFFESLGNEAIFLITPPVDLEFAIRAEVRFRHAQMTWNSIFGTHHDELQVFYKTHLDSSWTEANIIGNYLDAVESWTGHIILVPDGALGPATYFGFKATTKYGWGVCIDDVAVVETGNEERVIDTLIVSHENLDMIPSGSKDNPILRVDIKVAGNSGIITLNSLIASSLNTSDTDIAANGVKLYHSYANKDFYAADPYDTVTLSAGEAAFHDLSLELPTGYTYLWITYDVSSDAIHGHYADAMIGAMNINIGGTGYPDSDLSPAGKKIIYEAVYFDDFQTDKGWTLGGDFERGRPKGLGGTFIGNPDPENAAGDTMIIGNDLSGLGAIPGDYEPNVARYINLATSPPVNLAYYKEVKMNFLRWLNIENSDTASVEMSLDGGTSWNQVWTNNNNLVSDSKWSLFSLDLPGARGQGNVRFRINLGPTNTNNHFSGWNIDNFSVTGNYIAYDVGITALLSPFSGCGHTPADTVRVKVRNFGPSDTPGIIPARYSFNGGASFTYDTIREVIPFNDELIHTFKPTVDLSAQGIYNVLVETFLDTDEEPGNNSFDTVLYIDPDYALPYFQDFEEGADFWRSSGTNNSWGYGKPSGSVITGAASGTAAWVTCLSGSHNDNEESYLTGPCFDFTGIDYPVFECRIFANMEEDVDGTAVEYSLDNGNSWSRLGNKSDGDEFDWNWYNSDLVPGLPGNQGWSGSNARWMTARIFLDTLIFRGLPSASFRFRFSSDASNSMEGIGVDDIRIYDAPRDLGVISIDSPVDGCLQDLDDHVMIDIKNFGLDTLAAGDSVIAGYKTGEAPAIIEAFTLDKMVLRNDTFRYMFRESFFQTASGTKNITAFTLLPDDNNFYNNPTTNDTTGKSFDVLDTPVTNLPDHLYTLRPDTLVLDASTGHPGDSYLWQDNSTDSVFHITEKSSAMYHVVADNGICDFRDTTYIHYLIVDAGISGILHPVSSCEPDDSVAARVKVTNFGSYTWEQGEAITVGLIVHGAETIEEVFIVGEDVLQDSSAEYTFHTVIDMSAIGTYDISAYTVFAGDDSIFNDSAFVSVEIYGMTAVNLGTDTLVRAITYLLDAGAGNDSYLWQDASTGQTFTVDTTGWYSVTVRQGIRCAVTDSVHVTMIIQDIAVGRITNLHNACQLTTTENLDIRLRNTGSDTLSPGDTIAFTFRVNEGGAIPDTLFITQELLPGDSLLFTFTDNVDLSDAGSYQFTIISHLRTDLVPYNDTIRQAIEVYGYPRIYLGNDTIVHADSLLLDAGEGYESYLWHDSTSGRYYTVYSGDQTADRFYSVRVYSQYGCASTEKIRVSFETADIGIVKILLPLTGCGLGDQEMLTIRIMNSGESAVINESIRMVAIINSGSPVSGQLNFSEAFSPGDSLDYTFDGRFDFSGTGEYRIDLAGIYEHDIDGSNDSLVVFITHFEDPLVEMGGENDTIKALLPYTLDAGEGFAVYSWNGADGMQTFEADAPGWYKVKVTDANSCTATDSVYILSALSVKDINDFDGGLRIFPNPAREALEIKLLAGDEGDFFLELIDMNSQIVISRYFKNASRISETLDVSGIPAGVYLLRIRNDKGYAMQKVVIQ